MHVDTSYLDSLNLATSRVGAVLLEPVSAAHGEDGGYVWKKLRHNCVTSSTTFPYPELGLSSHAEQTMYGTAMRYRGFQGECAENIRPWGLTIVVVL